MAVKRRKGHKKQRQFWANATEEARYEYLVDSGKASAEILDFHKCEEKALFQLLQKHVERREKLAFIEIGCGPGRIIREVSKRTLEHPATWGESIKFVVGVDFEIKMIDRAIDSLIKEERLLRELPMKGTVYEIAESINRPVNDVMKDLYKRVFFINADIRFPFLRCESVVPIVAVMFAKRRSLSGCV
jgi:SAM-dependent methyltransferase